MLTPQRISPRRLPVLQARWPTQLAKSSESDILREKDKREKQVIRLVDLVIRLQLPILKVVEDSVNPKLALAKMAAGRRAATIKNRITAFNKLSD